MNYLSHLAALTTLLLALGCSDDDSAADSGTPDLLHKPDVTKPDGKVTKPDSKIAKPDGKVTKPDSKVTKPDSKIAKPDSKIAKPDSKIAKPDSGSGTCSAKPSGYCKLSDPPCLWSGQTCKCLNVCSGAPPPPGKQYAWKCTPPLPAGCPPKPPVNGAKCNANGLKCVYGHCPATRANCVGGTWQVKTDPLPP